MKAEEGFKAPKHLFLYVFLKHLPLLLSEPHRLRMSSSPGFFLEAVGSAWDGPWDARFFCTWGLVSALGVVVFFFQSWFREFKWPGK